MNNGQTVRKLRIAKIAFAFLWSLAARPAAAASFLYQGQLFDVTGTTPLTGTATFVLEVLSPAPASCVLYAETQSAIPLDSEGRFSVVVGTGTRTGSDPGLTMSQVFANSQTVGSGTLTPASGGTCSGTYASGASDLRFLQVTVTPQGGSANLLTPNITLGGATDASSADTLAGLLPTQFLQITGNGGTAYTATKGALDALLGTQGVVDASALHNHDSRYVQIGTTPQNIGSGGWYTSGAVGVGISAPPSGTQFEVTPAGGATVAETIVGAASQTADLFDFKSSGGSVLASFSASGFLTLPGAPTTANQAATKGYVDGLSYLSPGTLVSILGYTPVSGATSLTDVGTLTEVSGAGAIGEATGLTTSSTASITKLIVKAGSAQGTTDLQDWLNSASGILYSVNSSGTPTATTDLVTKGYLVSATGGFLPLSGGTMTGALTLPADGLAVGPNELFLVGGNVGIGTTAPAGTLDVEGGTASGSGTPGSNVSIVAQNGSSAGNAEGGSINLTSGLPHGTGQGGAINLSLGGINPQAVNLNYSSSAVYSPSGSTGSAPTQTGLFINNSSFTNGSMSMIVLSPDNSGGGGGEDYFGVISPASGSTPAMVWGQSTSASSWAERMRIDTTGNVGIATTSPQAGLDVAAIGTASSPGVLVDGAWFTGGTTSTTTPQFLVQPTGTTSSTWSTAGTGLGVNAAASFVGNLVDFQLGGTSRFRIDNAGNVFQTGNVTGTGTSTLTGTYSVNATGSAASTLGGGSGPVTIGGGTGTVSVATSGTGAVSIGDSTDTVTLQGTALSLNSSGAGTTAIGAGTSTGLVVIGNPSNVLGLMGYEVGIGTTVPTAHLMVGGSLSSSAWSTNGISFRDASSAFTDTSSSGTVPMITGASFGVPSFSASAATTYTNAINHYIGGVPVAGTNVTFTNSIADYIGGGTATGATNAYGLYVLAPTGATNVYSAAFVGGPVGVGTAAPAAALDIASAGGPQAPGLRLDGAWYSGGTSTTTKPLLLLEPSGTPSAAWSTAGTGLGLNAASAFAGNLIDLQANGSSKFSIDHNGSVTTNGGLALGSFLPDSNVLQIPFAPSASASNAELLLGNTALSGASASGTYLGINSPSGTADFANFQAGGSTEFRITGQGRVGILTASPVNALDIAGGIALGTYAGTTSAPTNGMIISGNVGIGTTANTGLYALTVNGTIVPAADTSGSIGASTLRYNTIYAVNATINTSDAREKKEIVGSDLGLDFLNRLRPVSYRWKAGPDSDLHYGLIAQETEKALRQSRSGNEVPIVDHDVKSDRYGLRYTELISPMIKGMQELYGVVKGQGAALAALTASRTPAAGANALLQLKRAASAPEVCTATSDGALVLNTRNAICVCDAAKGWVAYGSTDACAW